MPAVATPQVRTAEIAEVLARSQSRKEAALALGIPATTLERLCREQALVALYEALAERGTRRRGRGKVEKRSAVRRWSFYWRVANESVCIWTDKVVDAVTAEEAVDVFMLKVAPKTMMKIDVSAVEVTT